MKRNEPPEEKSFTTLADDEFLMDFYYISTSIFGPCHSNKMRRAVQLWMMRIPLGYHKTARVREFNRKK